MTTFQQLETEWDKDCVVDYYGDLGDQILRGSRLHQKWLHYLNEFRIKHHEYSKQVASMEEIRRRFHKGEATREELTKYGWEPYNLKSPTTNAAADKLIELDPVMIDIRDKLFRHKMCIDMCESVLWKIRDRSHDIRAAIDWKKFEDGR